MNARDIIRLAAKLYFTVNKKAEVLTSAFCM